jgi:hypothetical protein
MICGSGSESTKGCSEKMFASGLGGATGIGIRAGS